MQNAIIRLLAVSMVMGGGATANAQQTLNVMVLEEYETLTMERGGAGCFDVLAALRLQSELAAGAFTDPTRLAFSLGACVVASPGVTLLNAQKVEIENARFMRGAISDLGVTVYMPEALANVAIDGTAAAPLAIIADDLKHRVGEMKRCSHERDVLDGKIDDFNLRVKEVLAREADEVPESGSRLKGNRSVTVTAIELADAEVEALQQESLGLKAQATSHKERCGAYEAGITLDQDYMTYFQATTAAVH